MHREHDGSALLHRRLASTQEKHDVCLDRRFMEGGSGDILSWATEKEVELDWMVSDAGENADENGGRCGGGAAELRSCGEAICGTWRHPIGRPSVRAAREHGHRVRKSPAIYEPRIVLGYSRYKAGKTKTAEPQPFFWPQSHHS